MNEIQLSVRIRPILGPERPSVDVPGIDGPHVPERSQKRSKSRMWKVLPPDAAATRL